MSGSGSGTDTLPGAFGYSQRLSVHNNERQQTMNSDFTHTADSNVIQSMVALKPSEDPYWETTD